MIIKDLIETDTVNYKKLSMFIAMPNCTFKCCNEIKCDICQNMSLVNQDNLNISKEEICDLYFKNPLTEAIVFGGLEPFDSKNEIFSFVDCFRRQYNCNDDIVIYTGYTEDELDRGWRDTDKMDSKTRADLWEKLKEYGIIVKFGRFIPNEESHIDNILGVELNSQNQYARVFGGSNENNCE